MKIPIKSQEVTNHLPLRSSRSHTEHLAASSCHASSPVADQSLMSADKLLFKDLAREIPLLEHELHRGREHFFHGETAFRLIQAVVNHDKDKGEFATYFESSKHLQTFIAEQRATLTHDRHKFFVGALKICSMGHHAAIVGLMKKRSVAILIIDSIRDPRARLKKKHAAQTPEIIAPTEKKSFSSVKLLPYSQTCEKPLSSALSTVAFSGTTYDSLLFKDFRDQPDTSIYYTYSGVQSSFTDCAAFSLFSMRAILKYPNEQTSYFNLLDQREAHVQSEHPEQDVPALARVAITQNVDNSIRNKNFVLKGEELLAPIHYLHTQSSKSLQSYCNHSPYVTEEAKRFLLQHYQQNCQPSRLLTQVLPTFRTRRANLSIRREQLTALQKVRDATAERLAHGPEILTVA